jgi:flagella basal body P-ring formation protein FlgA
MPALLDPSIRLRAPLVGRLLASAALLAAMPAAFAQSTQMLQAPAPSQTPIAVHAAGSPAPAGPGAAARGVAASPDATADAIRVLVEREVGPGHRVEIQVGQLDPRLTLAPCGRIEPYVPAGSRLWGRTSLGARCVQGASWAVLVPVQVNVFGKALVANAPLAAGAAPGPDDFRLEEVELTREFGQVVSDAAVLGSRVLTRPLRAGQVLKQDALRVPATISPGDPVRLVLIGQGFTIVGEGVALNAAGEGQPLRVRTESGKVVTGALREGAIELKI